MLVSLSDLPTLCISCQNICCCSFLLRVPEKVSVLTYWWQLEYDQVSVSKKTNIQYEESEEISELIPVYHKISVDLIQKHCLILPYEENSQFVMEIIDQEL